MFLKKLFSGKSWKTLFLFISKTLFLFLFHFSFFIFAEKQKKRVPRFSFSNSFFLGVFRWKNSSQKKSFEKNTALIITWGGLRGGLSIALALNLPDSIGDGKDLILILTYGVVLFTILVQLSTMLEKLYPPFFKCFFKVFGIELEKGLNPCMKFFDLLLFSFLCI